MTTPDKIYLGIQDLGSGYTYDLSLDDNGGQEYIRKDALMEWAKNKIVESEIAMDTADDHAIWGQRNAFKQVLDKLNSM